MSSTSITARQKRADLAASAGAGVLGFGLGAMLAEPLSAVAVPVLVIGVLLHGWGMLEKRRLEAQSELPRWASALFWACWAALATLLAWIGLTVIGG